MTVKRIAKSCSIITRQSLLKVVTVTLTLVIARITLIHGEPNRPAERSASTHLTESVSPLPRSRETAVPRLTGTCVPPPRTNPADRLGQQVYRLLDGILAQRRFTHGSLPGRLIRLCRLILIVGLRWFLSLRCD